VQIVYTFYSPSAEKFADSVAADYRDYLPFDAIGEARATITAIAPTAFIYCKLDLWPNFTRVASLRGIRLGMISATVSDASRRRGWMARRLLREAYMRLDAVGAISDDDAGRIVDLGARPEVVFVTGDTRYDQVSERAAAVNRDERIIAPLKSDVFTVVAGSTWPADEKHLLPAFAGLHDSGTRLRLIIAPHEPRESHLRPIERWASRSGLSLQRLGTPGAHDASVLLVDRVGALGDLYSLADVAFVGGGFHAAGLHSVIEPAAFGVPVLFGPLFRGSRDAQLLIRARGGSSVRSAAELRESLATLMQEGELLERASRSARSVVEQGVGAVNRSYELVDALLTN
jgi:3-deoxy-D-manno-octulosonic-acid transferase